MLRSDQSHVGVTFGHPDRHVVSPHLTDWSYEGRTVVNGPDAGPVGTFVRLTIGIGGFRLFRGEARAGARLLRRRAATVASQQVGDRLLDAPHHGRAR